MRHCRTHKRSIPPTPRHAGPQHVRNPWAEPRRGRPGVAGADYRRNHFASWTGTAPIDASTSAHVRHRLSRAGNRRLNHVLYMAQLVQLRNDTEGRAYYRRKLSQGKTSMEAMRCLRRRLSDVVYRQLVADAKARTLSDRAELARAASDRADPGGHPSRSRPRTTAIRGQPHTRAGAPEASTWSAPPDERR